jgi:hypothetical protein
MSCWQQTRQNIGETEKHVLKDGLRSLQQPAVALIARRL